MLITGQLGSEDTGINTAFIQTINEGRQFTARNTGREAEDDEDGEDRLLLLEDTQTMMADVQPSQGLLDSNPTNRSRKGRLEWKSVTMGKNELARMFNPGQIVVEKEDKHQSSLKDSL